MVIAPGNLMGQFIKPGRIRSMASRFSALPPARIGNPFALLA